MIIMYTFGGMEIIIYKLNKVSLLSSFYSKFSTLSSVLPRNFKTGDNVPVLLKMWGHFRKKWGHCEKNDGTVI